MRSLWPIEQKILALAADQYPASAAALREQISTALVVKFENSGAGFFSDLAIADDTPPLDEKSPLDAAYGTVAGIEHGMGFLVFLENGRVSMIEGYCNGGEATAEIDFSQAPFELMPWAQTINQT